MTTSKRLGKRKVERFEKNITRRGSTKKGSTYPIGHIILGLFVFAVIGSYIFQMDQDSNGGIV